MSPRVLRRLRRGAAVLGVLAAATAAGLGVAVAATGTAPVPLAAATPTGSLDYAPSVAPPDAGSAVELRLFAVLNQQRAANGLGPLTWAPLLWQSAHTHDLAMGAVDTLSHQLPGEADLGTRITATGYRWRAVAENIGWNGQADDAGAVAIQWMFYDETPPDDGHRRNILWTATTQVGISVVDDGHGKVWVTEDFGGPA